MTIALADIAKAVEALATATALYESAKQRAQIARSEENMTLNELNSAQKKLDELVAGLKKGAHGDSDWGRNRAPRGAEV